ncbi:MAG: hypothetical protein AUK47_08615 [Deltaproteobacteria bacterium CG2_30_63_29]|nr:MAG: hypothetical protein AUK47_08615 [Deltaproteobacteria bacterium CG2_30_63_29]PJB35768.1 MAG: hypothetical protein CO108_24880 [Deltaproteobacteria bacterium CG_4_9_14_3_um_filter_63_12]
MTHTIVLTFTGRDRPGIVDELAGLVADHGGNWEESHMANLAGRFAGILKVSVDEAKLPTLQGALEALKQTGLAVLIDTCCDGEATAIPGPRRKLELTGVDRPGIVHEVAHVVAHSGISIGELASERFVAPHSGKLMFRAEVWLEGVEDNALAELQSSIEALAHDLVVDIQWGDD